MAQKFFLSPDQLSSFFKKELADPETVFVFSTREAVSRRFATSRNQTLRTKENTKSIFLELPGVGEKRAVQLQKAFTTLEDLAATPESAIAQAIHVRAQEAADILLSAKNLLSQRNEKKDLQRLSLGQSGTTKEKAAEAQYLDDLASQALQAAENEPDYRKDN